MLKLISQILDDPYTFDDQSMDLIYVDGDHSYEGVLKDLKAAIRLLKPGTGWLAGHDFHCNGPVQVQVTRVPAPGLQVN